MAQRIVVNPPRKAKSGGAGPKTVHDPHAIASTITEEVMAATKRKSNPTKKRRTRKKATKRRTSKRRKNPTRKRRTRKKATKRRASKRRKNPTRKRRTRKKATKRRRTSKRRKNPTRKRRTTSKRRRRTSKRRKNPNNSVAKRNPGGVLSATEGKACSASYPTGKGVMDKLLSVDSLIENGTLLAAAYAGKLLTKSYDMATSMALDPLLTPPIDPVTKKTKLDPVTGLPVEVGAGIKAGVGVIKLVGAITVGNVLDFMVFNRQKAWILNPRNGAVIHAQLLEHSVSGILKNFIKRPTGQAAQFLYDGTLGQPVKMHKYQTRHHTSGRLGLRKQGGQSYLRQPIREMQADRYYKGRIGVLPEAADKGFSMAGRRADAIYAAPTAPPRSPGLSGGYRAG